VKIWSLSALAAVVALLCLPVAATADLADDLYKSGEVFFKSKKYDKAAEAFLMALDKNSNHADTHYALGLLYMKYLDQPEDAVEHFLKYAILQPKSKKGRLLLKEARDLAKITGLFENRRIITEADDVFDPLQTDGVRTITFEPKDDERQTDAALAGKAEAVGLQGKEPNSEDEIHVITFGALSGKIESQTSDGIVINIGASDGVENAMEFSVYRRGEWVGLLKVKSMTEKTAVCSPVAGKNTKLDNASSWGFKNGDEVQQREDVLGAGLAREAEARKQLLDWQEKEKTLQDELKTLREREMEVSRSLLSASSAATIVSMSEELKNIHLAYKKWKRNYSDWIEQVLDEQESAFAGNAHIASYRENLKRSREFSAKNSYWRGIKLDINTGIAAYMARQGETLQERREALNAQSADLSERSYKLENRIKSFNNDRIKSHTASDEERKSINKDIWALNSDRESFDRNVSTYNQKLSATLNELKKLRNESDEYVFDYEQWLGGDKVYAHLAGEEKAASVNAALNAGVYYILKGKYAKAEKAFSRALKLTPDNGLSAAAKDGVEHAKLLRTMSRMKEAKSGAAYKEPRLAWKADVNGVLLGAMEATGGNLYGRFTSPDHGGRGNGNSFVAAINEKTGEIVWKHAVKGDFAGNWVVTSDEVIFADRTGVVSRLDANNGNLLSRWNWGAKNLTYDWGYLRWTEHAIEWVAGLVNKDGSSKEVVFFHVDVDAADKSFSASFPGGIADLASSRNVVSISGRAKKTGEAGNANRNAAINLSGSVFVSMDSGKDEFRTTSLKNAFAPWMFTASDGLAVNVLTEDEGTGQSSNFLYLEGKNQDQMKFPVRLDISGRSPVSDLAVEGETTYVLLHDGLMLALDSKKKVILWSSEVAVPAAGRSYFSKFLSTDGDSLVLFCGSSFPPWLVYNVRKEDGAIESDATISYEPIGKPLFQDKYIYVADQDGALRVVDLASDKTVWKFNSKSEDGLFIPYQRSQRFDSAYDGFKVANSQDLHRETYRNGFASDRNGNSEPLMKTGDFIIYYCRKDKHIYALEPDEATL